MEEKIISIGGVKFYESEAPAVGSYIRCRTKILEVCARKNGTKYGQIVLAGATWLELRGRFRLQDYKDIRIDWDWTFTGADDDEQYIKDHLAQWQPTRFEKFEEAFRRLYRELSRADTLVVTQRAEKFNMFWEKYPLFKMWVYSLQQLRGEYFLRDAEKAAVIAYFEENY